MVTEYKGGYEHEWFNGLINTIQFTHREVYPLGNNNFTLFPNEGKDTVNKKMIRHPKISIGIRLSFKERFITTDFYRFTLSSDYPIIQLNIFLWHSKIIQ